jgi:AcrR family transcriptional regulator
VIPAAEDLPPVGQARGESDTQRVRLERILDATYACFLRHGVRKTTMEDIASAAGMSRPAVYQYVRSKEDAHRRLVGRLYGDALAQARSAAAAPGTLAQRLDRVLAVKLALTQRLSDDSHHVAELLGPATRIGADLDRDFLTDLIGVLTTVITDAAAEADLGLTAENAREIAELALALARGLEIAPGAPERRRDRLRDGVALLVAGVATATTPR